MRQSKPYPIAKLIFEILEASGVRVSEFVSSLGYRRVNKGLRVLGCWLDEGAGDRVFIDKLSTAFPLSQRAINDALEETQKILAEEKRLLSAERAEKIRLLHKPCLVVQTEETRPTQIVIYALLGRTLKVVPLPKRIIQLPNDRAFRIVRWKIGRYLTRYRHWCPTWGEAKGFLYSVRPDRGFLFSCKGELVSEHNDLPPVLRAALEVRVAGGTFHIPTNLNQRK